MGRRGDVIDFVGRELQAGFPEKFDYHLGGVGAFSHGNAFGVQRLQKADRLKKLEGVAFGEALVSTSLEDPFSRAVVVRVSNRDEERLLAGFSGRLPLTTGRFIERAVVQDCESGRPIEGALVDTTKDSLDVLGLSVSPGKAVDLVIVLNQIPRMAFTLELTGALVSRED